MSCRAFADTPTMRNCTFILDSIVLPMGSRPGKNVSAKLRSTTATGSLASTSKSPIERPARMSICIVSKNECADDVHVDVRGLRACAGNRDRADVRAAAGQHRPRQAGAVDSGHLSERSRRARRTISRRCRRTRACRIDVREQQSLLVEADSVVRRFVSVTANQLAPIPTLTTARFARRRALDRTRSDDGLWALRCPVRNGIP